MLNKFMLFFIFGSGCFPLFSAHAAGCTIVGSSSGYVELDVPRMAIPADTPDGTILYTSPKKVISLSCTGDSGGSVGFVNAATTSDFNHFTAQRNGIKSTVYVDGKPISSQQDLIIATTFSKTLRKSVPIWIELKVDKSMGAIPGQGSFWIGNFESIYILQNGSYSAPRVIIALQTPNITFIPCTMELSVFPDTIDFSTVRADELDKGKKLQRAFTTTIKKSNSCLAVSSAPFGIDMTFEPTSSTINPDGSLSFNNGLGLSIKDASGTNIPYSTAWKIENVKVGSILKNNFTANLQKVAGQDVKTGPFSADVVVRMNYY